MTAVWAVDSNNPDPAIIARAADLIRAGKLVAMPTETVYGLAANALDEAAVRGIFAAKGRPSTNPLIVHVEDKDGVKRVASEFPEKAQRLADAFWPGPLSIVLPKSPNVPDIVSAGGSTVAVRCPDHAVARALIRAAGVPLAAPSANLSTELSPTRAEHVLKSMNGRIDAILDAGPCRVGIESTVVEVDDLGVTVLRSGTLVDELNEHMAVNIAIDLVEKMHPSKSPGLMRKHYCPKTKLMSLFTYEATMQKISHFPENYRHAVIYFRGNDERWVKTDRGFIVYLTDNPEIVCRRFYETLHRLDEENLDAIFIDDLKSSEKGWLAIHERITRAS